MRLLFLLAAFLFLLPGLAAGASRYRPPTLNLSYTPVYQFDTDIDSGGSFNVERHLFGIEKRFSLTRQTHFSVGLDYGFERWHFDAATAGVYSWREVHRPTVSLSLMHVPSEKWRLLVAPSIGLAATELDSASDSLIYGVVVSGMYSFGPQLTLGLGAGYFRQIDETELFPFVAIRWQITDTLRLQNPLRAGPVGPAGLELVYAPGDHWEFGLGGAFRSFNFLLSSDDGVPDGLAEVEFVASFLHIRRMINPAVHLDLTSGVLTSGEITVENSSGQRLAATSFDPASFVALTFSGNF